MGDDKKDIDPLQGNTQLNVLLLNPPQPVCNRRYLVKIKCPVNVMESSDESLEQPFI